MVELEEGKSSSRQIPVQTYRSVSNCQMWNRAHKDIDRNDSNWMPEPALVALIRSRSVPLGAHTFSTNYWTLGFAHAIFEHAVHNILTKVTLGLFLYMMKYFDSFSISYLYSSLPLKNSKIFNHCSVFSTNHNHSNLCFQNKDYIITKTVGIRAHKT